MEIRTINNGIKDLTVLTASEGKVLKRVGTDEIYGNEVVLGYSYYKNGEKLTEPHLDSVEDFEEVDAPQEEVEQ